MLSSTLARGGCPRGAVCRWGVVRVGVIARGRASVADGGHGERRRRAAVSGGDGVVGVVDGEGDDGEP